MKPFFGFIPNFLIIVTGFMAVTAFLGYILVSNNHSVLPVCATPDPVVFCGNMFSGAPATQETIQGKQLFNANCAACHKLYKKMVGPALSATSQKQFPSLDFIQKFVTNENALEGADRVYAISISEEYYSDYQHRFSLTEQEIEALIAYLN